MVVAIQKDPVRDFALFATDQYVNLCPLSNTNVGNYENTGRFGLACIFIDERRNWSFRDSNVFDSKYF